MNSIQHYDVVVIGAGASGALVAAQFKRYAQPGARLALIGPGSRPARGVAYETPYLANVLNVPTGNMSAFPGDREHFVRWLAARLPGADRTTFAPRRLYGDYLAGILQETLQGEAVKLLDATVTSLKNDDELWTVQLDSGQTIQAHTVVLAVGNALIPDDPLDFSAVSSRYRKNPWAPDAIQGLPGNAPVLLVGTGLTTVDVALSLRESGHTGPIHAVSRHGRLCQNHQPHRPAPLAELPVEFKTVLGALRWTRKTIAELQTAGGDWRAIIDSLRPHTATIWHNWTLEQRRAFLRHVRNVWDIHRHRMAPEVAAQLGILLADGVLTIHAGRLLAAEPAGASVRVTIHLTGSGENLTLDVSRVINCTGPSRSYAKTEIPLLASMREQRWLTPDPLHLGIKTDAAGHLIDVDGAIINNLFTIGPLRIPYLFESIAMPEIRVQAEELGKLLAESR
jgi:uncharacterized NAD(P)/FAD-binding protein YdhS